MLQCIHKYAKKKFTCIHYVSLPFNININIIIMEQPFSTHTHTHIMIQLPLLSILHTQSPFFTLFFATHHHSFPLQTITCDCDATLYLRIITTRTQGDKTTESEYACAVTPLLGRLNIATVTAELLAVAKFDGWPEVIYSIKNT